MLNSLTSQKPCTSCACCSHNHSDYENSHEQQQESKELWLLGVCAIFFFAIMAFENTLITFGGEWMVRGLYAIPYAFCGYSILKEALDLIRKGDIFNEFTLMCGATIAAICLDQLAEAVGVMLFYRVGEYVQAKAAGSSRRSIKDLLSSKAITANVLENGIESKVAIEEVIVGATILVRAGEKIPLDGTVLYGASDVDQSPLTGESLPLQVQAGSVVLGGSINLSGSLTIRADVAYADTHMAKILDVIEQASKSTSPTERFISRFARYYTPLVVLLAFLVAIIPPLFVSGASFHTWIYRALVLLVISCPCALLISIPLGYFGGIGAASRKGILVKGGNVMDEILNINTVVFDKTGTLTYGHFFVESIVPAAGVERKDLLHAAVIAECRASHPIAKAILSYADENGLFSFSSETLHGAGNDLVTQEIPGKGIRAKKENDVILAGTPAFMRENTIEPATESRPGAVVHIAKNNMYLGYIFLTDKIKPEAKNAITSLKSLGYETVMLTGDREEVAQVVAHEIGIDSYRAGLLPEDKISSVNELSGSQNTAFVGDGINDAPILTLSRVGIAMGGVGSGAAIEASDAVILNDSLENVVTLFSIAKNVRSIVIQNVSMALGIKLFIMGFGIAGLSGLWEAIFADVGVALLAVLNSSRIIRK